MLRKAFTTAGEHDSIHKDETILLSWLTTRDAGASLVILYIFLFERPKVPRSNGCVWSLLFAGIMKTYKLRFGILTLLSEFMCGRKPSMINNTRPL